MLRALNGEYILPEAGGDLLRDGPGVLPTGMFIRKPDPVSAIAYVGLPSSLCPNKSIYKYILFPGFAQVGMMQSCNGHVSNSWQFQ